MKSTLRTCSFVAALMLGVVAAPAAFAQGTWNFGTGGACAIAGSLAASASCTGTAGTATASIQMWANTGTGGLFVQGQLTNQGSLGAGGLAASGETNVEPDHAFDNISGGGTQQFMLINFSQRLNLSSLSIGWWGTDSDMAIYRWDGSSAPTAGTTLSGWKLVSSKDVDQGTTWTTGATKSFGVTDGTAVNGGNGLNLYSSWWLISTFTGGTTQSLDASLDDSFKLLSFAAGNCTGAGNSLQGGASTSGNGASCGTTSSGAPEPGSLALAGLAMLGVLATRRRVAAAA